MELKICHLYPDILNLYGDRGNVICMEKRLQWRGIDVTTTAVNMGDILDADAFDLIFIGNGQPYAQPMVLEDCCADAAYDVDFEPADISTSDSVRITFRIE